MSEVLRADSPPESVQEGLISREKITIDTKSVQSELRQLLESPVGPVLRQLFAHFKGRFGEIRDFLRRVNINRHNVGHMSTVTGLSLAIGKPFRVDGYDTELNDDALQAMAITAIGHDLGYEPRAHDENEEVTKEDVDYHPSRAALMWAEIIGDHRFDEPLRGQQAKQRGPRMELQDLPAPELIDSVRKITDQWPPELRETSLRTPWHHSNGSDYDRAKVPLAAKLVRLADKLDMRKRVDWNKLTPDIRETDPKYEHRTVQGSVTDMKIDVDHDQSTFNVTYTINTNLVGNRIGGYSKEEFLYDFDRAFQKAMERGAEVVQSLFEHKQGRALDSAKEWLTVTLKFGNTEEIRRYRPEDKKSEKNEHHLR